jgi:hypothetical protein
MTGDWRLSHAAAGNLNWPIHDDSTVCVRVLAADASKYVCTANSPRGVSVVARAHAGRISGSNKMRPDPIRWTVR